MFVCVLQVFPDVLHVCELGLCSADTAEDSKLEASLQVLPLVSSVTETNSSYIFVFKIRYSPIAKF